MRFIAVLFLVIYCSTCFCEGHHGEAAKNPAHPTEDALTKMCKIIPHSKHTRAIIEAIMASAEKRMTKKEIEEFRGEVVDILDRNINKIMTERARCQESSLSDEALLKAAKEYADSLQESRKEMLKSYKKGVDSLLKGHDSEEPSLQGK